MQTTMYLVIYKNNVRCAWPTKKQAQVYASGFSRDDCAIIEGKFADVKRGCQCDPCQVGYTVTLSGTKCSACGETRL